MIWNEQNKISNLNCYTIWLYELQYEYNHKEVHPQLFINNSVIYVGLIGPWLQLEQFVDHWPSLQEQDPHRWKNSVI